MTVAFLIARSALLLEHQNFVVLQVLQDLALYCGAFYYRCADLYLTVVVCKQDFVEAHGRVYLALKTVNIELPTLFSFKLLTCDLYDNVHVCSFWVCKYNGFSPNMQLFFKIFFVGGFGTVLGALPFRLTESNHVEHLPRILILSQDDLLAELVRASLDGIGAEIRRAPDLETLRRLAAVQVFDLVIALHVWPFCCGAEVVRLLRPERLRRPEIYVVSWQQSEQTVLGLLEYGVDQYMTFPLNLMRLRGKVIGALTR